MIKKGFIFAAVIAAFCVITSCTKVTDLKISSLEKSIDKLEQNYKDMSATEIESAIENCQKQFDALNEEVDKLTKEQMNKINNLEGRFDRVLVKIELYLMVNEFLDESGVGPTIEYIKGLLGAKATGAVEGVE